MRPDDRKPPLWLERDAELYGRNLTQSEFLAEDLDERPSLRLIRGGGCSSSSAWTRNSTGVDTTVAPLHRTRPVPASSLLPGDGPDLPGAA